MGGCFSEPLDPEEQGAKQRSTEIDKQLKRDKTKMERTIKLLLLGVCLPLVYSLRLLSECMHLW